MTHVAQVTSKLPHEMHLAGVSLVAVVSVARDSGIFPNDFIPRDDTATKCRECFWATMRERSASA